MTKMIVINTVGHFRIGFGLFFKASPGGRFSKDPVTYRARKAILETMIRLPWKAALLICFRYKERQNNGQVSKLETCSYWRYKGISVTRKGFGTFEKRAPGAHRFAWKLVFICMWMKINFHMKRSAPGLALKKRPKVIRKWPIVLVFAHMISCHVFKRNKRESLHMNRTQFPEDFRECQLEGIRKKKH